MPGAAGLQRVLEEESGDAGTSPGECDAGAACCSSRERGALFVSSPSLPGECWLVHCESWPPSGQATSNASNDAGLSVVRVSSGMRP